MRLRHIEVLFAIRKTGSISAAAAALSITQPAASKILKHAEQRLGFALFRRTHGRITPTEEAEVLLAEVEKVFGALERTRDTARILRERLDMRLRVACLPSLGFSTVPRAVQMFQKLRPRTTLEIAARHSREMIEALMAQEFDIGISFGPIEPEHADIGVDASLIAEGELVYIDHPSSAAAARAGPMRLSGIDPRRLIGLNASHYLGTALNSALANAGLSGAAGIQVQTYYIARALVAAGSGCAVIDEFTACAQPLDVAVKPIDPPIRFGVYAYTRAQHPPGERAIEFLDCVRAACREKPAARAGTARQRTIRRRRA